MSNLLSSFFIEPVARQARRLSGAAPLQDSSGDVGQSLSHANDVRSTTSPPPTISAQDDHADQQFAENAHLETITRSDPIAIRGEGDMSANPDVALENQLRRVHLEPPLSTSTTNSAQRHSSAASSSTSGRNAATMSESLPADDGMRHLRARIHEIRGSADDDDEKARQMHFLMSERYNLLRPTSPSSFVSHDRPFTPTSPGPSIFSDVHASSPLSTASEVDPKNPFNLRPGDTDPTYRRRPSIDPQGDDEDVDTAEDGSSFGCQHYKRNVKVQCHACRRWYTCRHCHDAVEDHHLNRAKTENMLCMACGTPQSAAESCVQCGTQAAWYYCDICKLWDDNSSKRIYHCMDCGICRKGEGLGKDFFHCKVCTMAVLCINI